MVIDDCWQEHHRLDEYNGGPWRKGNEKFPDMAELAARIKEKGARAGIWVRLLLNEDEKFPRTGGLAITAVWIPPARRHWRIYGKMWRISADGDIP